VARCRALLAPEPLEDRTSLAITSAVDPSGVLSVRTSASDTVVIRVVGGNVTINGADPDTGTYAGANVTAIRITGDTGANDIDLRDIVPALFPALRAVHIDGGGGGDRLTGPDLPLTWLVTADDTGSLTGPDLGSLTSFDFTAIANLVGGALADRFVFADGAHLSGSVDGGGGPDTLDFGDVAADLTIALAGSDTTGFHGTAGVLVGTFRGIDGVIGGRGTNTLEGEDVDSTWILNGTPTYSDGAGTLDFTGFEHLVGGSANDTFDLSGDSVGNLRADIEGGAGDDQFHFIGAVVLTGSIDGQSGRDTLSYAAFGSAVSVVLTGSSDEGFSGTEASTFSGGGFRGIDILTGSGPGNGPDTLTGEDVPSTWSFDPSPTYSPGTGETLAFSSFETLQGGSANDRFDLRAGDADVSTIAGGAGDDTLSFDARNEVVTQTSTTITAGGFAPVTYSDFETLHIFNQAETTPASADLELHQSHTPEPVAVGQSVTYTLTAGNLGPSDATGVIVTDHLPTGLLLVSARSTQGDCNVADGLVTCHLGSLAAGATVTITIVGTPQVAGTFSNSASVGGNEVDPAALNNTSVQPTTVVGPPTAEAQSVILAQGTSVPITLTGSDPNTPPFPLIYTVTANPLHGSLSGTAPDLTYTPAAGYFGADSFQFTARNGVATSAAATVAITVTPTAPGDQPPKIQGRPPASGTPGKRLLPDTPYFNYLRMRRSIDPARFDSYHPCIGAFLGLEISGIPTTPVRLLHANHRFDAAALRSLYAQAPRHFQERYPILGALFQLESVGGGTSPTRLLPATRRFNAMRTRYEGDPKRFSQEFPYYGAVFTLELMAPPENG
jgi:uncharacterized repeat protein (TIGR01451 family)